MSPSEQLAALRAHRPPVDGREAASWDEVAAYLAGDSPRDDLTHVTAAGIVVSERGIILLHHKRLGIWVQPGGHIEAGETPQRAALRESREETGLAIRHPSGGARLVHIDAHDGGRGHRHFDFRYVLWGMGTDPAPGFGESQQVRWCSLEEARSLADDGLSGLIRACMAAQAGTVKGQLQALSVSIS